MAKTLGIDIVIGSAVAGAVNGFRSVLGETNKLGSAIEKLNKEKLNILEETTAVKKFNDRLATLNKTLDNLYSKKKDLQLKKALAKTDEEAKKFDEELKKVNKRISALNRQKLNIKDELEKAKEEAKKTNLEFRALDKTLFRLKKYKLTLELNRLKREDYKSKIFDTIAIGATVSYPVKKAIEFESAMADVVKVANLSEEETKKMSLALEKLSTKIPIAADGLASIAASGASLGIAKDKLIDFTKVVAKMSTAFDMSADEAGEVVAKIMNVYGLGLKETTKLGDVLNYLSDNTAAKARDMINVLSRIGGTAKMFGLSAKNAAALADAFLAMGKPPEVAATAINALLTKLNTADKQGKKFQDGLKALGLNAIDIKFAIKNDPQKAIMMVLNRIKQFDKQTQMGILTDMFGAEYSDDIALLVAGLDNYKKALKLVNNEQGYNNSMQREFENRSKTTANQLQLLGNALNRIAIDLGSVVLPVLKTFADFGVKIADFIANFNQEFPILGKVITTTAIALGSFTVVGAAVGYFLTFIISGITRFKIALTFLSKALKINKLELILLDKAHKIFNRTALITKANLLGLKNYLSSISLKSILLRTKTVSLTIAKKAWGVANLFVSKSLNLLNNTLNLAGKGLLFIKANLKTGAIYAYNLALKTLNVTAKLTSNALKFVGKSLLWLGRAVFTNPIGIAITAIAVGTYFIYSNWNKLKGFFSGLWNGIKSIFKGVWKFIKNFISFSPLGIIINNWSAISSWFEQFWNWLKEKFNAGITFISNIFSKPVEVISAIWSNLANWFNSFWSSLGAGFKRGALFVTNVFLHPINVIKKLWGQLIGWIKSKIEWIGNTVKKIKNFFSFGGDNKEKENLSTAKKVVTTTVAATTLATAQPVTNTTLKPVQVKPLTVKTQTISPIKPISVPVNTQVQSAKNTQSTAGQTIVYNFNFGDIKVETKDGKIANPEELKEQLKQIIEEIDFERKQRSLSDVV